MTNRLTNGASKAKAETPSVSGFSRYKVCDSYSVPTTYSQTDGSPGQPLRLSKKKLEELDLSLSQRDKEVLLSVRRHRYLMSGQVQRLHFTDATNPSAALRAASRNLKKLKEFGLIGRLSRRIGGVRAGSGSYIWHITHAGERLLRLHDNRAFPLRRHYEPSPYFLAHTLATAEIAIKFIEICREHRPCITALQLEPECWRTYNSAGVSLSLKPDLYAVTTTEEYEDRYFIEVDLDTESPAKIIEKCQKYHAYYRSGLEQEESEMFPLTVWIVPSINRKEKLIRHLKEAFAKQAKLFAVITCEELEHLILEGGDREMLC